MELNRPVSSPLEFRTGPLVSASVPESTTCTRSGSHENGGCGPSKSGFQASTIARRPRRIWTLPYGMNVNFAWPVTVFAHPSSEPPRGRARALTLT